jgi:predicted transcriptional regulator
MDTQDRRATEKLVRTSVLIPERVDSALRSLAHDGDRPLSREIRRALEDHVAREVASDPDTQEAA